MNRFIVGSKMYQRRNVTVGFTVKKKFNDHAEEALAFHGVGRLNIAGSRFCTATLIAPDVIVTAAHCLFHPQTGKRVPESELRFVADG